MNSNLLRAQGVHTNCSPQWNSLLDSLEDGLYGLQLLILKQIHINVPWKYQTPELVEELVQDCTLKIYELLSKDRLQDNKHPGPYITVIVANEIFKKIPGYIDSMETVELEPDMVASKDNIEQDAENADLVRYILENATDKESKVLNKIINGIPINHSERQRLYRLRARLEKQGVQTPAWT